MTNIFLEKNIKDVGLIVKNSSDYWQVTFSFYNDKNQLGSGYISPNNTLRYDNFSTTNYKSEVQSSMWNILSGAVANTFSVMWQDVAKITFVDTDTNSDKIFDPLTDVRGVIGIGQAEGTPTFNNTYSNADTYPLPPIAQTPTPSSDDKAARGRCMD